MIKINLLPKSIDEKRKVKNLAILFGFLAVVVLAAGVFYTQACLVPSANDMEAQATSAENLQKQVEGIEAETKNWSDQTSPIQTKLTFINNVLDYNLKYPKLYEDIAKWTYEKIAYTGLQCDGTTVQMSARAKTLDDLGRFLLNMYHATDLFTEVTISGVPGYPMTSSNGGNGMMQAPMPYPGTGPQANLAGMSAVTVGVSSGPSSRYIDFTVNCKLRTPIVAPSFGGAAGAAAPGTPGAVPAAGQVQPAPAPSQPDAGPGPAPGGAGGPPA